MFFSSHYSLPPIPFRSPHTPIFSIFCFSFSSYFSHNLLYSNLFVLYLALSLIPLSLLFFSFFSFLFTISSYILPLTFSIFSTITLFPPLLNSLYTFFYHLPSTLPFLLFSFSSSSFWSKHNHNHKHDRLKCNLLQTRPFLPCMSTLKYLLGKMSVSFLIMNYSYFSYFRIPQLNDHPSISDIVAYLFEFKPSKIISLILFPRFSFLLLKVVSAY